MDGSDAMKTKEGETATSPSCSLFPFPCSLLGLDFRLDHVEHPVEDVAGFGDHALGVFAGRADFSEPMPDGAIPPNRAGDLLALGRMAEGGQSLAKSGVLK